MGLIRVLAGLVLALSLAGPASADDPVSTAPAASPAVAPASAGGQRVVGKARFGQKLRVRTGRWSTPPDAVRVRWLRDGRPVAPARKASQRRYVITHLDVGHRLSARVTAVFGASTVVVDTRPTKRVKHRRDVRRTVRYVVRTRGHVTADVAAFRRLAQQTYDDPRGWRGAGVRFVRVRSGGSMTLWLAAPGELPRFSPGCSAEWSCRVGRNVIINTERWQHASPAWRARGGSLRDYRHMVVNHETGHFLGLGHAGCDHRGALAPVMMQQSKGLAGCRFNPWPTAGELRRG